MQTLTDPIEIQKRRAKVNRLINKIEHDGDLALVLNSFPEEMRQEIYDEIQPKLRFKVKVEPEFAPKPETKKTGKKRKT